MMVDSHKLGGVFTVFMSLTFIVYLVMWLDNRDVFATKLFNSAVGITLAAFGVIYLFFTP